MTLSTTTKSWTSKFMVLDGSYLKLFNQALKNLELNKIEDKTVARTLLTKPENGKAG